MYLLKVTISWDGLGYLCSPQNNQHLTVLKLHIAVLDPTLTIRPINVLEFDIGTSNEVEDVRNYWKKAKFYSNSSLVRTELINHCLGFKLSNLHTLIIRKRFSNSSSSTI